MERIPQCICWRRCGVGFSNLKVIAKDFVGFDGLLSGLFEVLVEVIEFAFVFWDNAVEVFVDHGNAAVEKVSKVVSKVGIKSFDELLWGELSVLAEDDFSGKVIANSVDTKTIDKRWDRDDVAFALAHFAVFHHHESVDEDSVWLTEIESL